MRKIIDPFLYNTPKLDLHGENRYSACTLLDSFIRENIILDKSVVVVIHGVGRGIIKNTVHDYLKKSKSVLNFYVNNYNSGETIIYLKKVI